MRILFKGPVADGFLVRLSGEFDASGCKEIRDELEPIVDEFTEEETLFLNLFDVSFIDSSGVGAIVFLYKRLKSINGSMKITNVHGQPKELLSLLRVNEAIPVEWLETDDMEVNYAK